jgi:hypothetical protein
VYQWSMLQKKRVYQWSMLQKKRVYQWSSKYWLSISILQKYWLFSILSVTCSRSMVFSGYLGDPVSSTIKLTATI